MKKKVVPKLRQEVKVTVDIITSDDIKIHYTGKFQDFTAKYIIKYFNFIFFTLGRKSINSVNLSLRKCDVARKKSWLESTWFLKINDRKLQ